MSGTAANAELLSCPPHTLKILRTNLYGALPQPLTAQGPCHPALRLHAASHLQHRPSSRPLPATKWTTSSRIPPSSASTDRASQMLSRLLSQSDSCQGMQCISLVCHQGTHWIWTGLTTCLHPSAWKAESQCPSMAWSQTVARRSGLYKARQAGQIRRVRTNMPARCPRSPRHHTSPV